MTTKGSKKMLHKHQEQLRILQKKQQTLSLADIYSQTYKHYDSGMVSLLEV